MCLHNNTVTQDSLYLDLSLVCCSWRYRSLLRHSTCHHCHHLFVLTTPEPSLRLGEPFANASQPTPFDSKELWLAEYIGEREGERVKRDKMREFGALPSRLRRPRRLRREGHIQVFYAFDSTKSCGDRRHCIKTQTFANSFRHHCSTADIYKSGQKWF